MPQRQRHSHLLQLFGHQVFMGSGSREADSRKLCYNPPGMTLMLSICSSSLKTYQCRTTAQLKYSRSHFAHCGTGRLILSWTHNYIPILSGMLGRSLETLELRLLMCTMSLGQGTCFGILKYATCCSHLCDHSRTLLC